MSFSEAQLAAVKANRAKLNETEKARAVRDWRKRKAQAAQKALVYGGDLTSEELVAAHRQLKQDYLNRKAAA